MGKLYRWNRRWLLHSLPQQVFVGALFRAYTQTAAAMDWRTKDCWRINRGDDLAPVWSCDGLGDPHMFYVAAVWTLAAFTTAFIFLLATELRFDAARDSLLGMH